MKMLDGRTTSDTPYSPADNAPARARAREVANTVAAQYADAPIADGTGDLPF